MAERVDSSEELANEAISISRVMQWVIESKEALDGLRFFERHGDCQTKAKLTEMKISQPDWEGLDMADSVGFLLMRQRELINQLAKVATHHG